MKSVIRTIVRVVTRDKRKRTVTLRPKGMKPDYNGCMYIIVDGQTVSGSQVASKVSTIICDVELGKSYMLPEYPGRDPARVHDGIEGRGFGKKRRSIRNESFGGSKFALTRKWC